MYRHETCERLRTAICSIIETGAPLWSAPTNDAEVAQSAELLARRLADQLWVEGYELTVRVTPLEPPWRADEELNGATGEPDAALAAEGHPSKRRQA